MIKAKIANYNVAVQQRDDGITFLRRIIKGATNHSYGIEVAKLAGIPKPVLSRAGKILENLEAAEISGGRNLRVTGKSVLSSRTNDQMSGYLPLLEPNPAAAETAQKSKIETIYKLIKEQDLNRTTPIKALNLLVKLQKLINNYKR